MHIKSSIINLDVNRLSSIILKYFLSKGYEFVVHNSIKKTSCFSFESSLSNYHSRFFNIKKD